MATTVECAVGSHDNDWTSAETAAGRNVGLSLWRGVRGRCPRCGRGCTDEQQKETALTTIAEIEASGLWPGPVVTEINPEEPFWQAEPEHQNYLQRHPRGYSCHFVRPNSGDPRQPRGRKTEPPLSPMIRHR
jgi:Peptide methionine sulfoxide reductase